MYLYYHLRRDQDTSLISRRHGEHKLSREPSRTVTSPTRVSCSQALNDRASARLDDRPGCGQPTQHR